MKPEKKNYYNINQLCLKQADYYICKMFIMFIYMYSLYCTKYMHILESGITHCKPFLTTQSEDSNEADD